MNFVKDIIASQRFKALLTVALTVSGFVGNAAIQKWFPGLTPSDVSQDIISAIPVVGAAFIEWYRNHPDNVLARAIRVINGGSASASAVANVAKVANQ